MAANFSRICALRSRSQLSLRIEPANYYQKSLYIISNQTEQYNSNKNNLLLYSKLFTMLTIETSMHLDSTQPLYVLRLFEHACDNNRERTGIECERMITEDRAE